MSVAVQASHSPGAAWEETIVPTLRKRLEQESRMLENRLSVHSLLPRTESPVSQPPPTGVYSRKEGNRSANLSSSAPYSSIPRNYSDTYRPTAIPRPSSSMAHNQAFPSSADRISRPSTSMAANPSSNSVRTTASSKQGVPFTRTRTRSTPYPFDKDDLTGGRKTPNGTTSTTRSNGNADPGINGMPTPASSRANSPMMPPHPRQSEPRPSKIPMARRKRARSTTSNPADPTDTQMKSASMGRAASAAMGMGKKRAPSPGDIAFPPSPETSPDIWRDQSDGSRDHHDGHGIDKALLGPGGKIIEEAPPFNPNRLSRAPSFEEREFEHWYRGEGRDGGGRNGGRGEIKLAKADTTKEMLDIAVGGHQLGERERWDSKARRDTQRSRTEVEQYDYVPHERELTDMEEFSDQPYERATTEDYHESYYASTDNEHTSQPGPSRTPQKTSVALPRATPGTPSRRSSKEDRSRSAVPASRSKPQLPTISASPRKPVGTPMKSPTKATPSRSKSRPRQRAVSRPKAPTDSSDRDPALADAMPPWERYQPENADNWDEVVLPTVAKKMGMGLNSSTNEITMLGVGNEGHQPRREGDRTIEPAPGTFAYDATKYRAGEDPNQPRLGGSRSNSPYPPRKESPPPFSQYTPAPPVQTPKERAQALKSAKPTIIVTSPSEMPGPASKDDEGAGCCKCTIM